MDWSDFGMYYLISGFIFYLLPAVYDWIFPTPEGWGLARLGHMVLVVFLWVPLMTLIFAIAVCGGFIEWMKSLMK